METNQNPLKPETTYKPRQGSDGSSNLQFFTFTFRTSKFRGHWQQSHYYTVSSLVVPIFLHTNVKIYYTLELQSCVALCIRLYNNTKFTALESICPTIFLPFPQVFVVTYHLYVLCRNSPGGLSLLPSSRNTSQIKSSDSHYFTK